MASRLSIRVIDLIKRVLGYPSVPAMSRPTFHFEIIGSILGSVGAALLLEGFGSL